MINAQAQQENYVTSETQTPCCLHIHILVITTKIKERSTFHAKCNHKNHFLQKLFQADMDRYTLNIHAKPHCIIFSKISPKEIQTRRHKPARPEK